jgi:glycerophosphoryl diester phosphodiesterase
MTLIVAHRGEHQHHLENTLSAFTAAFEAGCDMVELDVQLSLDQIPVIFHDDDLQRLGDRPEKIDQLAWHELRQISLTDTFGHQDFMPCLRDYLAQFSHKPTYFELKVPGDRWHDAHYLQQLYQKTLTLFAEFPPHPDSVFGSFHPDLIQQLLSTQKNIVAIANQPQRYQNFLLYPKTEKFYYSLSYRMLQQYPELSWYPERTFLWDFADTNSQDLLPLQSFGLVVDQL